jgi:Kef-type K+ transport system membrane component KefB
VISSGLLIFFLRAFNELFNKTKIPNVLLLLFTGILIGPVGGIVTRKDISASAVAIMPVMTPKGVVSAVLASMEQGYQTENK